MKNFPNIDIFSIEWSDPSEKLPISCCIEKGNRCIETTPVICDLYDGNPVGSCEEIGSCCMQNGSCEEMTECECQNLDGPVCGGICWWKADSDCGQSNPCDF